MDLEKNTKHSKQKGKLNETNKQKYLFKFLIRSFANTNYNSKSTYAQKFDQLIN